MTLIKVTLRPSAAQDMEDLALYLVEQSLTAAERFIDALEQTKLLLSQSQEVGARFPCSNPKLHDARIWQVKDFPNHVLIYIVRSDCIEIVRVLHAARDLRAVLGHDA